MKKRNWLLGSLRKKKKEREKKFSESEKYRVYVLRDKVSTMFNIATVIILQGTNLHKTSFKRRSGSLCRANTNTYT